MPRFAELVDVFWDPAVGSDQETLTDDLVHEAGLALGVALPHALLTLLRRRSGHARGMAGSITVSLDKRGASGTARLLDDLAPRTCAAVWDALPRSGDAYHAKYARNEIYALLPTFAQTEPGIENPAITPIPGDLCYFTFQPWQIGNAAYSRDTN